MGWNDIGVKPNSGGGGASDLIKLEGQKRLRLLIPQTGPESFWSYAISTPNGDYRTWIAPPPHEDFFAKNRRIFNVRPVHAGLAYDYDEQRIGILEGGNQIWEGIKTLVDAGKDLSGRDILITKKGTGRNTEYTVTDCDPTPFNIDISNMPKPDIAARYKAPTYEAVLEDLRQLGFTNPEEIFQMRPMTYEEAIQVKVPFGKNKDKTLLEVYNTDSSYLLFLATRIDRIDVKEAARVVCNTLMGTAYELSGIAPSMEEVHYVPPQPQQAPAQPQMQTQPQAPMGQPQYQPTPAGSIQQPNQYGAVPQQAYYQQIPANQPSVAQQQAPQVQPPQYQPLTVSQFTPPPAQASMAPPQAQATLPTPQAAPAAPTPTSAAPAASRDELINRINAKFESDPVYRDFMKIIEVMKQASAPAGKTSISQFTDQELQNLATIIGA